MCERLKAVIDDKENFKALYDDSLVELKQSENKNERVLMENSKLKENIKNLEIEIEYYKE